jgi:hypothetical protein
MPDVVSFRMVFYDTLSIVDGLTVKSCGPSVHHGTSAFIIYDINRAKNSMIDAKRCGKLLTQVNGGYICFIPYNRNVEVKKTPSASPSRVEVSKHIFNYMLCIQCLKVHDTMIVATKLDWRAMQSRG